jgi:phage terminase small subunit
MKPPPFLNKVAKQKWRSLSAELGQLDAAGQDALAQYCSAWSSWLAATEDRDRLRWSRAVRQWGGELRRLTPPKTKPVELWSQ